MAAGSDGQECDGDGDERHVEGRKKAFALMAEGKGSEQKTAKDTREMSRKGQTIRVSDCCHKVLRRRAECIWSSSLLTHRIVVVLGSNVAKDNDTNLEAVKVGPKLVQNVDLL